MNASTNLTGFAENRTCNGTDTLVGNLLLAWHVLGSLLVILFNGFTMIILCKYAKLETPTNIFLALLTFADLTTSLELPSTFALGFLQAGLLWNITCFVDLFIKYSTSLTTLIALCLVAIDRLIYIVYALRYHSIVTQRKAVLAVWIVPCCGLSFTLVCLSFGYRDSFFDVCPHGLCIFYSSMAVPLRSIIGIPYIIFIPLTLICHFIIMHIARIQRRAIAAESGPPIPPDPNIESDFKFVKIMHIVLFLYIGCNLPIMLHAVLIKVVNDKEALANCEYVIWRLSTWVNPIVYVLQSERFRQHIKNFFKDNPLSDCFH